MDYCKFVEPLRGSIRRGRVMITNIYGTASRFRAIRMGISNNIYGIARSIGAGPLG
jgi:hypothetical protein